MSTPLLQLNHYFGIRQQPLRRVLIYAPTLIWVQQGRKQLWWREQRLSFDVSIHQDGVDGISSAGMG